MAEKGWISIYRKIRESWVWKEKKFDKTHAWIDLLLSASHKDKKIFFDGNLYEIDRGSFITSIRKLCEHWGWSNTKVKKFLNLLQNDEMITYKSDTKKTIITIVNYNVYQDQDDAESDTETSQKHHSNITETSQKHTINNINNINNSNNDNKIYIPCREVIDYLNSKAGTSYRATSNKTKTLVHARFAEKFTLNDFKTVIDKKVAEWKGTEWEKFLRPETLFGSKFESYLNQKEVQAQPKTDFKAPRTAFNSYDGQRHYDMKELEKKLLGRDDSGGDADG